MKIVDYDNVDKALTPAMMAFVLYMDIRILSKKPLAENIPELIGVICVSIAVLLVFGFFNDFLRLRHYTIDEHGITSYMFHGKIKAAQFSWDDFRILAMYNIVVGRAKYSDIVVLSTKGLEYLPNPGAKKDGLWYWSRFKSIVVFDLTMDRMLLLRQFCDIPLTDNR